MLSPPELRQPRLRVLADNTILTGAVSAEITTNNHYAADRFRVDLQTSAIAANAWSATDSALIDIQLSLDGVSFISLIQGDIDHIRLDPLSRRLTLEGRDLTARLIQARTQESFVNQTASQIATTLAARHGLSADVTATTTPVGAYWQLEHDCTTLASHSRSVSEWDLLIGLAGHEGFNVWVNSSTLYFQPPPSTLGPTAILRPLPDAEGPANLTRISMERSLLLAQTIAVTVQSWNSRQAARFSQTVSTDETSTPAQTYVYVVPNLTPAAALQLAQSRLAEITGHERVIEVDMPGELSFAARQQVQLTGTNTAFDQTYWIDEITRRIDVAHGFTQRLRARNSSPVAQASQTGTPNWNAS